MSGTDESGRPGRFDPHEPDAPWEHGEADVGDVRLHYAAAGPADGDLVVLLHGFPEFWYAWRHQLPVLADAGYRVVAPDMRGYNRSDKPEGVDAYRTDALVADVVGLIHAFDRESAHVVGHDWGGGVAWATGSHRPDVVDRLAVLNAPHPASLQRELRRNPTQLRKSWYLFYFQVPRLPEFGLTLGDCRLVGEVLEDGAASPAAFTGRELRHFRAAFCREGAPTATVNYYRAAFRESVRRTLSGRGYDDETVPVPTLVLWGERDGALSTDLLDGLEEWVPDLRVRRFPDASHWLQADQPGAVSRRLVDWVADARD